MCDNRCLTIGTRRHDRPLRKYRRLDPQNQTGPEPEEQVGPVLLQWLRYPAPNAARPAAKSSSPPCGAGNPPVPEHQKSLFCRPRGAQSMYIAQYQQLEARVWLMTEFGFYSIVQKRPDEYHIRARERKDLENLVAGVPLPQAQIQESDVGLRLPHHCTEGRRPCRVALPGGPPRLRQLQGQDRSDPRPGAKALPRGLGSPGQGARRLWTQTTHPLTRS